MENNYFVNRIFEDFYGGSKITGIRKMNIVTCNSDDELSGGSEQDLNEIEEIIKKQTNDMFDAVVKKFMEKVSKEEAIKMKDELYEKISKSHYFLNDYDRALKMLEIVNEDKQLSRYKIVKLKKKRHRWI